MRIGYACKCVAVPGTRMSTCIAAKVTGEYLKELIGRNLAALDRIMDYNIANDIKLFRISSDLIPFGSSTLNSLDWTGMFAGQLRTLGEKAANNGIRLSMHPGQYTVINSPDPEVVNRAVADLMYHCRVLDAMGCIFRPRCATCTAI